MSDTPTRLHRLATHMGQPERLAQVLEEALHGLRGVMDYDLAAIYRLRGDTLVVAAAAGPLADARVRAHRLDLAAFPTVRRALRTRRPIPLEAHDHASDEGDPYDGVLDLPPGHSCMVVPLFTGARTLGIITLDRTSCGVYPSDAVEMAGVYGQLVSMAMSYADQAAEIDRYRHQLVEQNRLLVEETGGAEVATTRLESAHAPRMRALVQQAQQVGRSDVPVLVQGETGTGKEVLAQALHAWSPRALGPFVKLNCSAIPDTLVESELFGHVRGAFSGAERDRPGRFRTADGGTLLLDEIGDMPLSAQARLLRVLQEGAFEPVGSDETVRVDVRVIAATHVDLAQAVRDGRFREDLYYRLAVFPLQLPPLRQRTEDVPALADAMLAELATRPGRGPWTLTREADIALRAQAWPGNVRQLRNTLERATILRPSGSLDAAALGLDTLPAIERRDSVGPGRGFPTYREAERGYLAAALARTEGRIYGPNGAAQLVDLRPTTLQSKLQRAGLKEPRPDAP
jgi:transcriptional regulator with GAF, ATPase, and Fis domain